MADMRNKNSPQKLHAGESAINAPSVLTKDSVINLDEAAAFENNPKVRMEFAHENIKLSSDYMPINRIGYLGSKREQFVERMNKLYGEGNWTLGYIAEGETLTRNQALDLYQKSYEAFFKANPEYTQRMLRAARDVYDTNISNVASGLNWHAQEDACSHLQDIAVRRAVKELGLTFQGDKLLQIRGRDSDLPELNPGRVPFISQEIILTPPEFTADWVKKGSIEDFWQNNKFLFVRTNIDVVRTLHEELDTILAKSKRQDWKIAGEKLTALIISGDADIDLVRRFTRYVEYLQSGNLKGSNMPDNYPTDWAWNLLSNLSVIAQAQNFSNKDIMRICETLIPAIRVSQPSSIASSLANAQDVRIPAAILCALADQVDIASFADGEIFHVLLTYPEAMDVLINNSVVKEYLRNSKIATMQREKILGTTLATCPSSDEEKERFIAAITNASKS